MEQENASPFSASIFSQAAEIAKEEGYLPSGEPEIKYDVEDLRYLVEMPFDCAALVTEIEDIKLSEKQATQLAKLWCKPLERLSKKYPQLKDMDMYIAASATIGIITEKYLIYASKSSKQHNDSTGNEGQR